MSLRFRLNLLVTAMSVAVLVLGALLVIHNARRAVFEETQSTANLALQLLEVAFAEAGEIAPDDPRTRLLEQIEQTDGTRHLSILLADGEDELPVRDASSATAADAPAWYVRLVAPPPMEFRRPIGSNGTSSTEIVVRADPADEIAESWVDARGVLGLVLAFLVVANGVFFIAVGRWLRPLERVVAALDDIERGDYETRLPAFRLPELNLLARKLNHMAGVLEQSRKENRYLAQQTLAIQEGERRYLAQELHDELGQSVSAIRALAVSIGRAEEGRGEGVAAAAATIAKVASDVYGVVTGIIRRLRPVLLDEFGLVRALEALVDDWNARHPQAFCHLTTRGRLEDLGETVEIHLYRVVQESLTNVSKHAAATEVRLELERSATPGGDRVCLTLADNGVGFDPHHARRGLGLLGIRERVEALQGVCRLESGDGRGVRLTVEIPLPEGQRRP